MVVEEVEWQEVERAGVPLGAPGAEQCTGNRGEGGDDDGFSSVALW